MSAAPALDLLPPNNDVSDLGQAAQDAAPAGNAQGASRAARITRPSESRNEVQRMERCEACERRSTHRTAEYSAYLRTGSAARARQPGAQQHIEHCPPASGPRQEARLRASNGASCSVAQTEEGERILVRDAEDRVVVSFDPATGKAVIQAPSGIAFRTDGDIDLQAKGRVNLRGKSLGVAAERADLTIANTKFRGLSFDAAVEEARHVAARVETIAGKLISRAKQVFRTVEDAEHVTAGRQRTVVKTSYRLEAGHAALRAEEEVKIDGKQIYLG